MIAGLIRHGHRALAQTGRSARFSELVSAAAYPPRGAAQPRARAAPQEAPPADELDKFSGLGATFLAHLIAMRDRAPQTLKQSRHRPTRRSPPTSTPHRTRPTRSRSRTPDRNARPLPPQIVQHAVICSNAARAV